MFLLGLESRFVVFFFAWCIFRLTKDLNTKSNCSVHHIFSLLVPIKKEFSVMYLNNRGGGACRNVGRGGGRGLIKGSFIDGTGVHGCHCRNLTTAWLA